MEPIFKKKHKIKHREKHCLTEQVEEQCEDVRYDYFHKKNNHIGVENGSVCCESGVDSVKKKRKKKKHLDEEEWVTENGEVHQELCTEEGNAYNLIHKKSKKHRHIKENWEGQITNRFDVSVKKRRKKKQHLDEEEWVTENGEVHQELCTEEGNTYNLIHKKSKKHRHIKENWEGQITNRFDVEHTSREREREVDLDNIANLSYKKKKKKGKKLAEDEAKEGSVILYQSEDFGKKKKRKHISEELSEAENVSIQSKKKNSKKYKDDNSQELQGREEEEDSVSVGTDRGFRRKTKGKNIVKELSNVDNSIAIFHKKKKKKQRGESNDDGVDVREELLNQMSEAENMITFLHVNKDTKRKKNRKEFSKQRENCGEETNVGLMTKKHKYKNMDTVLSEECTNIKQENSGVFMEDFDLDGWLPESNISTWEDGKSEHFERTSDQCCESVKKRKKKKKKRPDEEKWVTENGEVHQDQENMYNDPGLVATENRSSNVGASQKCLRTFADDTSIKTEPEEDSLEILYSDEMQRMKELNIIIDWQVPLLHSIPRTVIHISADEMKKINKLGLPLKSSRFIGTEDEIIKRNWEKFKMEYGITTPSLFWYKNGAGRRLPRGQLKAFLQYLGRGLNDRVLSSIYRHFRLLVNDTEKSGFFTKEEDEKIIKYVERKGTTFNELAKEMKRTNGAISKRWKMLKHGVEPMPKRYWTEEEKRHLYEEMSLFQNSSRIPWKQIAKKLNRSESSVKSQWKCYLQTELNTPKKIDTTVLKCDLIERLYNMKLQFREEIPWQSLVEHFQGATSAFLSKQLTKCIEGKAPKGNWPATIEYLYCNVLPKLRQQVAATAKQKTSIKKGQKELMDS